MRSGTASPFRSLTVTATGGVPTAKETGAVNVVAPVRRYTTTLLSWDLDHYVGEAVAVEVRRATAPAPCTLARSSWIRRGDRVAARLAGRGLHRHAVGLLVSDHDQRLTAGFQNGEAGPTARRRCGECAVAVADQLQMSPEELPISRSRRPVSGSMWTVSPSGESPAGLRRREPEGAVAATEVDKHLAADPVEDGQVEGAVAFQVIGHHRPRSVQRGGPGRGRM